MKRQLKLNSFKREFTYFIKSDKKPGLVNKILLTVLSVISFGVTAQIADLPVSATPTTLCVGDSSIITVTGTDPDVKYSLRNSSNTVIGATQVGNGSVLNFSTGAVPATETFNIYAEPNFHSGEFNGVDTYAQMSANNRGVGWGGMTIGAWIKTSLTGVRSYVASKYAGNVGYLFYVDVNGKMRLDGRTGPTIYNTSGPSLTTVNDGQWHYVVGTTNGQCWNIYVDGVFESSQCNGFLGDISSNNTEQLRLGMFNFQNYFEGEIDDFFLLNTAVPPATVTSYYTTCLDGTEPNCTALFNFDEASFTLMDDSPVAVNGFLTGNTYVDQGATACAPSYGPIQMTQTATITVVNINDETVSGPATICGSGSGTISTGSSSVGAYYTLIDDNNNIIDGPIAGTGSGINFNTGTISSTTTFSVNSSLSSSGPTNSSLDFDGIDDYVNFGGDFRDITNAFSVGCWVKTTTSNSGSQFLITKYDLGFNSGFVVIMDDNGYVKIDGKGFTGTYLGSGISSTQVNDGQWHYVVGTGSIGGFFKIYVDGVLENTGTTAIDGSVLTSTGELLLGRFNTNYANVELDQAELWNIELTLSQIQSNMNSCLDSNDPNLVGYFLLNEGAGGVTSDISQIDISGSLVNMDASNDWLAGLTGGCLTSTGCNLTMTQEVTVTVDNDGPVADVASLPVVNGQCEVTSLTAPTASDFCTGTISGTHNTSFPIISNSTITWTYDDGDGNTTTQTQNVVINDDTAPIEDVASLADITAQCEVTSLTAPTATDNCAGTVNGTHNASLPISSNTVITWTYDDGDGNTSTQTQNVVINDNIAPVANSASLADINSQCAVTTLTAPTATDNCFGLITGTHNATFPITTNTVVTWTYLDGNGNSDTQVQNVNVNDNIAPVANTTTLVDITEECSVSSLTAPTATDNCAGTISGTHNATFPITSNMMITWTYEDANGNTSSQTQSIVIDDITAPVADVASLSNLTAPCEITALTAPTATDNCVGSITGTPDASLPISASTTITWTYDDGNGNISTQTQNVVINDNVLPITDAANLADLTAQCEITSLTAPTASDNCAGAINGVPDVSLPISSSTTITWTYDDGNGNVATQTQMVIISDNSAPVEDVSALADINETCEVTSLVSPTATDNCLGTVIGTHNIVLPISTSTLITWTYEDGNGNITTQTQQVNITDAVAPVADNATLSDIIATCEVSSLTPPTATDNCVGTINGTHTVSLPITANTIITWTYTDENGNVSTQDQQIIINDVDATVNTSGITLSANNTGADSYQWVDCDNGNSVISGETGISFTPTNNGNYAVEVTEGNCTETSACQNISTVGINEFESIQLTVYPNPTNGFINIETTSTIEEVMIVDMKGSVVQRENKSYFSIEKLVEGTYILRIKTNSGVYRKKLIKQQ